MERIIKFKAKRLDNGEWAEGYYYKECDNTYIIEDRQNESMLNRNEAVLVDPSTVCQFVGFEDVNHTKVYEHDIVRDIQTENKFELIWHNLLLGFYFNKEEEFYERQGMKVLIVGNRFDRKDGEK